MSRKDTAKEYFSNGYNCSQSVVLAFSDMLDTDKKTLAKISSSFGGGMGRLREVCGAVTGMFIVIGHLCGYEGPDSAVDKLEYYEKIQSLAKSFEEKTGSIICRNLIENKENLPCVELVGIAAEILEDYIANNL